MSKIFVLDTSAIFTYLEYEAGADKVERILVQAKGKRCEVFVSFITLMEIYYISWQRKGEDVAKELVVFLKSLPITIVESSERLILSAGRLKANHKLSVADAIIAAIAVDKSATLVHKDPELDIISQYTSTLKLPTKA